MKLNYPGEYIIEKCSISATSGRTIDVSSLIASINIFEDIFRTSITGDISLVDTNNLLTSLPIIGQEKLLLKLSTPQTTKADRTRSLDFTEYPLYIYKDPQGKVTYLLQMAGVGLWGPIWGYLALDQDGNTVKSAIFGISVNALPL